MVSLFVKFLIDMLLNLFFRVVFLTGAVDILLSEFRFAVWIVTIIMMIIIITKSTMIIITIIIVSEALFCLCRGTNIITLLGCDRILKALGTPIGIIVL